MGQRMGRGLWMEVKGIEAQTRQQLSGARLNTADTDMIGSRFD